MKLHKIINNISNFFNKSKKSDKDNKLFIKKPNKKSNIKKRRSLTIKSRHIEKLKILGNNVNNYYILIFTILIVSGLYITIGPLFKVNKIEIIKQDNITNMEIAYKAVDQFRGEGIIKIDEKEVLKKLQDYQQNIRDIKTRIILPSTLRIQIDSYKGLFNTTINGKTFIITENGTLIPSNYSKELKTLNIKTDFDTNKLYDYKQIFNPEFILKIYENINSLSENIVSIRGKKFTYYLTQRELHIETDKKTILIFDLDGDYNEQIEKLAIFNRDYLDLTKTAIIYIDLRIKNKVFYCTVENEYQCLENLKKIYPYE